MRKIVVSRDDSIYEAWPDLAMLPSGRMICVFSECTHHGNRDLARIVTVVSDDQGETWSEKHFLTAQGRKEGYFNCARIFALSDGRAVIICDYISGNENGSGLQNYLWFSEDGVRWSEPQEIPLCGIVPDFRELKSGRWLAAAHRKVPETGKLTEYCIYSDDKGRSWSEERLVAADPRYNLCEVSLIEVEPDVVVGYMRENSGMGYDCMKAISRDGGETWEGVYNVPVPGCHRPKAGILMDGNILITYRFFQGGKSGWGNCQNTFGAAMKGETALQTDRQEQVTRIFPIDYDRNPKSDLGYTGWVQLPDGDIYMVNYLMDDASKAWIRASRFSIDEFVL